MNLCGETIRQAQSLGTSNRSNSAGGRYSRAERSSIGQFRAGGGHPRPASTHGDGNLVWCACRALGLVSVQQADVVFWEPAAFGVDQIIMDPLSIVPGIFQRGDPWMLILANAHDDCPFLPLASGFGWRRGGPLGRLPCPWSFGFVLPESGLGGRA